MKIKDDRGDQLIENNLRRAYRSPLPLPNGKTFDALLARLEKAIAVAPTIAAAAPGGRCR